MSDLVQGQEDDMNPHVCSQVEWLAHLHALVDDKRARLLKLLHEGVKALDMACSLDHACRWSGVGWGAMQCDKLGWGVIGMGWDGARPLVWPAVSIMPAGGVE